MTLGALGTSRPLRSRRPLGTGHALWPGGPQETGVSLRSQGSRGTQQALETLLALWPLGALGSRGTQLARRSDRAHGTGQALEAIFTREALSTKRAGQSESTLQTDRALARIALRTRRSRETRHSLSARLTCRTRRAHEPGYRQGAI